MKKSKWYKGIVFLLITSFVVLTGALVGVTGLGSSISVGYGNAIDAKVDTVKWARENGVVGLSFGLKFIDSANVKSIVVKRVINGAIVTNAVAVADTISGAAVAGTVPWSCDSAAYLGATWVHAITMTPYADEYWVLVQYNTTSTRATWKNSSDTTTVRYEFIKQYSK